MERRPLMHLFYARTATRMVRPRVRANRSRLARCARRARQVTTVARTIVESEQAPRGGEGQWRSRASGARRTCRRGCPAAARTWRVVSRRTAGVPTRKKVNVRSNGTCVSGTQCRDVDGFCSDAPVSSSLSRRWLTTLHAAMTVFVRMVRSASVNMSSVRAVRIRAVLSASATARATLLAGEQGRPYARVRFTLRSDPTGSLVPTLYLWNLTYFCKSAQ